MSRSSSFVSDLCDKCGWRHHLNDHVTPIIAYKWGGPPVTTQSSVVYPNTSVSSVSKDDRNNVTLYVESNVKPETI